ncbi:hypothetical protein NEOLEDRAFT_801753 [Neolentinus lepideus HHB14362 ss-1]|uniref:Uncharacterized protein n=1 Tax=Neolentinus lepideus HHB14362 ss-1 TaxID=1314782 RepID=A0A165PI67_9AGAM|nr:hypothetical protein NEOLEDRAFT_801753 [Neolentinus lepideus HHB14362 ss-1]
MSGLLVTRPSYIIATIARLAHLCLTFSESVMGESEALWIQSSFRCGGDGSQMIISMQNLHYSPSLRIELCCPQANYTTIT